MATPSSEALRWPRQRWPATLRRSLDSSFVRGGALVVGATFVWHLSNLTFNLVAARVLGPGRYGELAATVTVLYLASPLFVSVQTVASRMATASWSHERQGEIRALLRFYASRLGFAGILVAAAAALASSALARFLRISSPAPLAILACAFPFYVITHMQRGALQGTLRFGRYAISTVTEGLLKVLTATAVLLAVWKAVDAAVLAVVASAAAAVVVNRALLGFLPRAGGDLAPTPHPYRYSLTTLGCMVLLAALLSVDVLAAKRYLGAHDAGIYASASLCGKVVFFATSSLSLVAFPLLSSHHERGIDARGPFTKALALVAAASAVLVAVYAIAPRAVVVPLFGERFAAAAPYLVWMGAAFAFYAVAYLAAMFLLSQKRLAGITALAIGALAQLAGFYCFHGSIHALVAVNAVVFAGTAAALLAMAFRWGGHAS